jgi:putative phosphoesterase
MHISIISDSHGLLRDSVIKRLQGTELIIHAGDIGSERILKKLKDIAPVVAVRGNCDREAYGQSLALEEFIEKAGKNIFVIHNLQNMRIDAKKAGIQVVIHGHSHRSELFWENDILYLNPGSIGPLRFSLPIAMAEIIIDDEGIYPQVIELTD